MAEVVGIRFKRAGRVYYFDPSEIDLEVNDCVVVKTVRGMEMGQVVIAPKQVLANEIEGQLKPVIRKAEPEDIERARELYREALAEFEALGSPGYVKRIQVRLDELNGGHI